MKSGKLMLDGQLPVSVATINGREEKGFISILKSDSTQLQQLK